MNNELIKEILNEIKEIKSRMASKDDLQALESRMATKEDLHTLESTTKDDLQIIKSTMATKEDIQDLKQMIVRHHVENIEADSKLLEMITSVRSDTKSIHDRLDHQIGRIAKTEESLDILQKKIPQ